MYDRYVQKLSELGPPKHQAFQGDAGELRQAASRGVQTKDGVKPWSIANGACACNKMVPVANFRVFNTGLVSVVDNVCPGCRGAAKDLAVLVCPRCRAVVARMAPGKDKTGFVFAPNCCYHVDCCPRCEPEIVVTHKQPTYVLEMLAYMKRHSLPLPPEVVARRYKKKLLMGGTSA